MKQLIRIIIITLYSLVMETDYQAIKQMYNYKHDYYFGHCSSYWVALKQNVLKIVFVVSLTGSTKGKVRIQFGLLEIVSFSHWATK
jgi:hypothetical protein